MQPKTILPPTHRPRPYLHHYHIARQHHRLPLLPQQFYPIHHYDLLLHSPNCHHYRLLPTPAQRSSRSTPTDTTSQRQIARKRTDYLVRVMQDHDPLNQLPLQKMQKMRRRIRSPLQICQ